jgi:fucose 4-O-acetylase-like acetyltransferase
MRAYHVDVARALCITLVVFGHSELAGRFHADANTVLATLRMPFFFLLSGLFFRPEQTTAETAWRKADALLKPYLVLAVLYAPFFLFVKHQGEPLDYLLGVLSFNGSYLPGWLGPMWFLALLWAVHTGCALLMRWGRLATRPMAHRVSWIALMLLAGYTMVHNFQQFDVPGIVDTPLHGLPFSLDLWPIAAAFFLIGYFARQPLMQWTLGGMPVVAAVAVFLAVQTLYEPRINLLERRYHDLLASTVSALSGAIVLLALSRLLARSVTVGRLLSAVGQVSLYILLFHDPIQSLLSRRLRQTMPNHEEPATWLALVATIGLCYVLARLIQRFAWTQWLFECAHVVRRTHGARHGAQVRTAPKPVGTPLPARTIASAKPAVARVEVDGDYLEALGR